MAQKPPDETEIETPAMTPFIDVVFQLLIFFMLSLHFKEIEAQLVAHLPRGGDGVSPEVEEVHVVLCTDGDLRSHLADKARHEAHPKDGRRVWIAVDAGERLGVVRRTEDDAAAFAPNREIYRRAAARAAEIARALPLTSRIVIDADSEVPYEHVIGVLNELKRLRIENVEFTANPRLAP